MQRGLMTHHEVEQGLAEALEHEKQREEIDDGTPPPWSELIDYEGNVHSIQKAKRMLDKAEAAMKRKDYPGALKEIGKAALSLAVVPADAEQHIGGSGKASHNLSMAEMWLKDLAKHTRD